MVQKATSWLIHPSWLNSKDRVSLLDALSQDEKTSTAQVGRGGKLDISQVTWIKLAWNGTLKVRLFEKLEGHSGPSFFRVSVGIIVYSSYQLAFRWSSWILRTDPRSACMCSRRACSSCTLFSDLQIDDDRSSNLPSIPKFVSKTVQKKPTWLCQTPLVHALKKHAWQALTDMNFKKGDVIIRQGWGSQSPTNGLKIHKRLPSCSIGGSYHGSFTVDGMMFFAFVRLYDMKMVSKVIMHDGLMTTIKSLLLPPFASQKMSHDYSLTIHRVQA